MRQFRNFKARKSKNGGARNVLISIGEYERLKERDQQAFQAAETPQKFLAGIEAQAGEKRLANRTSLQAKAVRCTG